MLHVAMLAMYLVLSSVSWLLPTRTIFPKILPETGGYVSTINRRNRQKSERRNLTLHYASMTQFLNFANPSSVSQVLILKSPLNQQKQATSSEPRLFTAWQPYKTLKHSFKLLVHPQPWSTHSFKPEARTSKLKPVTPTAQLVILVFDRSESWKEMAGAARPRSASFMAAGYIGSGVYLGSRV